jgi:hypothetical protein
MLCGERVERFLERVCSLFSRAMLKTTPTTRPTGEITVGSAYDRGANLYGSFSPCVGDNFVAIVCLALWFVCCWGRGYRLNHGYRAVDHAWPPGALREPCFDYVHGSYKGGPTDHFDLTWEIKCGFFLPLHPYRLSFPDGILAKEHVICSAT